MQRDQVSVYFVFVTLISFYICFCLFRLCLFHPFLFRRCLLMYSTICFFSILSLSVNLFHYMFYLFPLHLFLFDFYLSIVSIYSVFVYLISLFVCHLIFLSLCVDFSLSQSPHLFTCALHKKLSNN